MMAIDRGRLYRIESDVTDPHPGEVRMMADLYNEPELCNYYCRKCCPLGKDIPEVRTGNIDKIVLDFNRASLHRQRMEHSAVRLQMMIVGELLIWSM